MANDLSTTAARAAEPARKPLTKDQIDFILRDAFLAANGSVYSTRIYDFVREIEREHGIAASPTSPTGTEKKDAEPVVHQGMTIAGDGAAMLGRLMREQRASRLGVYPDGNPNAGTEKP